MSKSFLSLALLVLVACGSVPTPPAESTGGGGGGSSNGGGAGTGGGAGGGSNALATCTVPPNPSACDRASQTTTADIALLDCFKPRILAATTQSARDAEVAAFLDAVKQSGGTPLQDRNGGTRVAFIHVGTPTFGYSVAGEMNNWTEGQLKMSKLGDSDLYLAEADLPRTRGYAYKLVDGTGSNAHWFEDLRSRQVVWDNIPRSTIGEFNAMVYAEKQDPSLGRLEALRAIASPLLGSSRDVFVYVPAQYDDGTCKSFPSIYFHDGNESVTRGHFNATADSEYAAHPAEAAVLVFVALPTQDVRMNEYEPYSSTTPNGYGDTYLQMIQDELIPRISQSYRVCSKATDRGVSGASLGGLMSGRAGFERSSTFGFVGSQSGSYFWNNGEELTRASQDPVVPVRWYLDYGCTGSDLSADNCGVNRQLADALRAKGYAVTQNEEANAQHDWPYWQGRMPALLADFRQGKFAGCTP